MEQQPTGEQIVEKMAAGREWWRLRACDIAPWVWSLPDMIRTNRYDRVAWIGSPWDGTSDIPLGEPEWDGRSDTNYAEPLWDGVSLEQFRTVVPGADARLLVAELRRLIAALPELGIALPDHTDVRACLVGPEGDLSNPTMAILTVDFDLGDLVLPLCIEYWQLRPDIATPMPQVAAQMVHKLGQAARHRKALLRRELRMREAFEGIMADIGGGAAPLWLRLEPLRFDDKDEDLTHLPYVAFDIRLDLHHVWTPNGIERVNTVSRLLKAYHGRAAAHRREVALMTELHAAGSMGWISDVALALIEERGLNPADVLREERDRGLHGGPSVHFGCEGHFGSLFLHHGVLYPYFTFESGQYVDGTLTLDGPYPEVLAVGAPGRPLAQFVDHPAFVAAGAVIDSAERTDERLTLHHTARLISAEEAERRWSSARGQAAETVG